MGTPTTDTGLRLGGSTRIGTKMEAERRTDSEALRKNMKSEVRKNEEGQDDFIVRF